MKHLILALLFLFSYRAFADRTTIISAGDMSGNINSSAVDVGFYDVVSVQAVWTGTPTGSLKLQASNAFVTSCAAIAAGDWSDISSSTVALVGSADNVMYNVANFAYKCLRLVYTRTGSTGVLNASISTKDNL